MRNLTAATAPNKPSGSISRLTNGMVQLSYKAATAKNTTSSEMAYKAGAWAPVDSGGVVPEGLVICLLETRAGDGARTQWVGTPGGLARREQGRWSLLTRRERGGSPKGTRILDAPLDARAKSLRLSRWTKQRGVPEERGSEARLGAIVSTASSVGGTP